MTALAYQTLRLFSRRKHNLARCIPNSLKTAAQTHNASLAPQLGSVGVSGGGFGHGLHAETIACRAAHEKETEL